MELAACVEMAMLAVARLPHDGFVWLTLGLGVLGTIWLIAICANTDSCLTSQGRFILLIGGLAWIAVFTIASLGAGAFIAWLKFVPIYCGRWMASCD